jgi:hypothetical protein
MKVKMKRKRRVAEPWRAKRGGGQLKTKER